MIRSTLLMFLMFGMSSSVLAMERQIPPKASDPSQEGKVHWQAEDRFQVVADDCVDHLGNQLKSELQGTVTRVIPLEVMLVKFDNGKITIIKSSEYAKLSKLEADQQSSPHSLTSVGDDTVETRTLGKPTVVETVADELDSPGIAALLSSSRTLATILRHTPAYGAHVEAKQRRFAAQLFKHIRWHGDLTTDLDQHLNAAKGSGWNPEMAARFAIAARVVEIYIGQPNSSTSRNNNIGILWGPIPRNRLSLRRHVRAQGEEETFTTKETLTRIFRDNEEDIPFDPALRMSPSDPSVTVSRSTLVEALFLTFSQYGAPKFGWNLESSLQIKELESTEEAACTPNGRLMQFISVASDVDEVKAQQLTNELVHRLTKKQIIIRHPLLFTLAFLFLIYSLFM